MLDEVHERTLDQDFLGEKLTVVLDYYEAMETYSSIRLVRSYEKLQSYVRSNASAYVDVGGKQTRQIGNYECHTR